MPIFFLHWGREGRKALPHVATLGSAGGCGQDGGRDDDSDGGDGCGGGGPWKSTVEAVVTVPRWACPCGASGESGRERAVASMAAQSEAVAATRVAVIMGAVIAATAAVNGGRLGGGGGLDRARGASTIPAERSGSGKGGYSTLLSAHALVSGSIGSYLEGSCQSSRSRAPEPNGWASKAGRAHGPERGVRGGQGRGGEA